MKHSKRISIILMAFIILAVTPLWGGALPLKDSAGIVANGVVGGSEWEDSTVKNINLTSGGNAQVLLNADKSNIYVLVSVNGFILSDDDSFSISVSGIGGSHSLKISRSGSRLSGSGTYKMIPYLEKQYGAECKFSTSITGAGKVTATVTIKSGGNSNSGTATLNLTVPTTAAPTTTKPTTTTTTKAPEKPNAQTTAPANGGNNTGAIGGNSGSNSSGGVGGNNNTGGSVAPPVGGTTAAGGTTDANGNTTVPMTTPEGDTIIGTTPEGETITLPPNDVQGNNDLWPLILGAAFAGLLVIVFTAFALKYFYKKKSKNNTDEDNGINNGNSEHDSHDNEEKGNKENDENKKP